MAGNCHTHPHAVEGVKTPRPRRAGVRTRGGWAVPPLPARDSLRAAVCARWRARAGASVPVRTSTKSSSAVCGGARAGCFGNRAFRHSRRAAPRPASGRALGAARLRALAAKDSIWWRVSAVARVARASATSHPIAAPAAWALARAAGVRGPAAIRFRRTFPAPAAHARASRALLRGRMKRRPLGAACPLGARWRCAVSSRGVIGSSSRRRSSAALRCSCCAFPFPLALVRKFPLRALFGC